MLVKPPVGSSYADDTPIVSVLLFVDRVFDRYQSVGVGEEHLKLLHVANYDTDQTEH